MSSEEKLFNKLRRPPISEIRNFFAGKTESEMDVHARVEYLKNLGWTLEEYFDEQNRTDVDV